MSTLTQSHDLPHGSARSLWFGFTGGAAAWAVHGFIWEMITSQACQNGAHNWGPISAAGVQWLLAAITLLLLTTAIAAGVVSFRNWRQLSESRDVIHAEGRGREQFMALGGMLISVFFSIGIIWTGLSIAFLDVCVKNR